MEPKVVYFTGRLVSVLQKLIQDAGVGGEIARVKLERGLFIAYRAEDGGNGGRMTLGRNDGAVPSRREIATVESELKKAVSNAGLNVLGIRELNRDEIGNWRLVRMTISYGRQLRLDDVGGDA